MATYSDNASILQRAGLDGNSFIDDDLVTKYRESANAQVNACVGSVYLLSNLEASSNFTGSKAEDWLKAVEELLGAGGLLINLYSSEPQDSDKDGETRLEQAAAMLDDLKEGNADLFGNDDAEFPRAPTSKSGDPSTGNVEDDSWFGGDLRDKPF